MYVTSQNHGYCISPDSLSNSEFNLWFSNADDKTVEGIKHKNEKCIAVQFHPEASPGPLLTVTPIGLWDKISSIEVYQGTLITL